jgi:hypothetical protein
MGVSASNTNSNVLGDYANGTATGGTYNVKFSKTGYQTKIINNVLLVNGVTTVLNAQLAPLAFGVASLENKETFLNGNTLFEGSTKLDYYLSNTDAANGMMRVCDMSGKVMMEQRLDAMMGEIAVGEGWAPGIYMVMLSGAKPVKIMKVN